MYYVYIRHRYSKRGHVTSGRIHLDEQSQISHPRFRYTQLAQTPAHVFREILHNCDNMTAYFSISSYTGVHFDLIPRRPVRIKKN